MCCRWTAAVGAAVARGTTSAATRRRRRLDRVPDHPTGAVARGAADPQQQEGEAVIRGSVFNDLNQNGLWEVDEEPPIQGAVAKLFSCSTGSRAGVTRTNNVGEYAFVVPNPSSSACYYVQYSVNHYILPNAVFTSPRNGETDDLRVVRGGTMSDVDAGIYGSTPIPTPATFGWGSYPPTPPGVYPEGVLSPGPFSFVEIPIAPSPAVGGPGGGEGQGEGGWQGASLPPAPSFEMTAAPPTASLMATLTPAPTPALALLPTPTPVVTATVIIPLPTETVIVLSSPRPAGSPSTAMMKDPALGLDSVVADGRPAGDGDAAGDEADEKELDEKEVLVEGQLNEQGNSNGENNATNGTPEKQQQNLPGNEELIKPSEEGEQARETSAQTIEDGASNDSVIYLKTMTLVRLEGVDSEMDDDATALFEDVCADFLGDQLQYATPPIDDVDCQVVGQALARRCRRGLRSIIRALAGGLVVDVDISGQARRTAVVRDQEDVQFDDLLVGTFNVQGNLFVEALEEAAEEDGGEASEYFSSVVDVRGVRANGAESQAEAEEDRGGIGDNNGVLAAIVAGGVVVLILIAVVVKKARNKRAERAAGAAVTATTSATFSSSRVKPKRGGARETVRPLRASASGGDRTGNVRAVGNTAVKNVEGVVLKAKSPPSLPASPTETADTVSAVSTRTANDAEAARITMVAKSWKGPMAPNLTIAPSADSDDIEITRARSLAPRVSSLGMRPHPGLSIAPSAESEGVEVGMRQSTTPRAAHLALPRTGPSRCVGARLRRDVMAPPGKLGIMIANTTGCGPAVHTVRPGSPMEGLVFANDIISSVNDVDTTEFTAEQITKVMKDTAGEGRKITVFSLYR